MKMEKLEVFAVDESEFMREEGLPLVLCVKLNDRWCKPLKDIGFGFDDVMRDQNKKMTCALWRFDPNVDRKVDMMFDPNTQLDEFQQRHLQEFLNRGDK